MSNATASRLKGVSRRGVSTPATVRGIGLFTGHDVSTTIRPVEDLPGASGIVFRRVDLAGAPTVAALYTSVVSEQRRTVLQAPSTGARVETVEHIMSALAGLGVTDALIDVSGPELPIGDGSALLWVDAITRAGVIDIAQPLPAPIVVSQPLVIAERHGQIEAFPASPSRPGLELTYRLDYGPGSPIPPQESTVFVPIGADPSTYTREIAPARTFSTQAEAEGARQMGLFTRFTPRDLLVIGPSGPIDNAYRFANEPARHKALDMLGDLSLAGQPISAKVVATRSGHALNHQMARALASLTTNLP